MLPAHHVGRSLWQSRYNVPNDGKRMFVIFGHMIDQSGLPAVRLGAAQLLSRNLLTCRGFHQRRDGQDARSEERCGGKEWDRRSRPRWSRYLVEQKYIDIVYKYLL